MGLSRRQQSDATSWVVVVVVGVVCLLLVVVWTINTDGQHDTATNSIPAISSPLLSLPIHHLHRHPPPLWGQAHSQQVNTGILSGIPVLMLVTTQHLSIIRRSIENVLQRTGGSGLELVVSVSSPSTSLLDLLHQYPIKVHTATPSPDQADGSGHFKSLMRRVVPQLSSVSSRLSNLLQTLSDEGVCRSNHLSPVINILNTGANHSQTLPYTLNVHDLHSQERGTPYMEHPYNHMFLKALGKDTVEGEAGDNGKGGRGIDGGGGLENYRTGDNTRKGQANEDGKVCQKSQELKEALQFVKDSYPKMKNLMLMETGYVLAPDIVSFLNQTLHATQSDPSVYCISAHNPLALPRPARSNRHTIYDPLHPFSDSPHSTADSLDSLYDSSQPNNTTLHMPPEHTRLLRYEHFLATATLVPAKVVDEIIDEFIIYEETAATEQHKSTLSWLETWLSWWSRRRRRVCIVPSLPRVCPLTTDTTETPPPPPRPTDTTETPPPPPIDTTETPPPPPPPPRQEGEADSHNLPSSVSLCSQHEDTVFDTSRLLGHQYIQDLFKVVEAAQPLGLTNHDCSSPTFFPEVLNSSVYIIYIKMENYDDDFTFHHFMKCFGLDLLTVVGYLEGVFQLSYRNTLLLLMGVPYSVYSPSMKSTGALLVADIPDLYVRGQTSYRRLRYRHFNFTSVLVQQKVL